LIAHPLVARRRTAPAVHAQRAAALVAPALANSAQVGPLGPKATARAPLPPAPANPAQAELDPATNAPDHPPQGSPRGSLKQVVPADPLPQAAPNRPSVPSPADFRSPVPASRAKPAADESRRQDVLPANAPAASPEVTSEANGNPPGCHTRASRARLSAEPIALIRPQQSSRRQGSLHGQHLQS
jgi:hypothetical protein